MEKYEILFAKVKELFDQNEVIIHAVNRKGMVFTELYYGEKEFVKWEDIFYNAIENHKENQIEIGVDLAKGKDDKYYKRFTCSAEKQNEDYHIVKQTLTKQEELLELYRTKDELLKTNSDWKYTNIMNIEKQIKKLESELK